MHQKWYKNGHLEKNHTKCSKLILICSIHKHTCEFQHLSTLREPTRDILYIVSTFCRLCWILRIHHKLLRIFMFSRGAFSMSLSLFFDFYILYFSSVSVFVRLYDLYVVSEKKTYKLFAKFSTINSYVIEKYISEKQTRKITAEFHKVMPVKPFINCLISCHTTLA